MLRHVIANGPPQHGITCFKRIEHRALRDRACYVNLDFTPDMRQGSKVLRKFDSDHGSVCTSTDSTAGRSLTIGAQDSPAFAEAYTWPPVVPK